MLIVTITVHVLAASVYWAGPEVFRRKQGPVERDGRHGKRLILQRCRSELRAVRTVDAVADERESPERHVRDLPIAGL